MEFLLLKLTSLMTAALALLASSCCYSFVDKHAQRAGFETGESSVDYRLRFNGLLQHLWYVEQIRSEQTRLAVIRLERKTLESAMLPRVCRATPVPLFLVGKSAIARR